VLRPAETCAICVRSLTDTGGKRLVAGATCGIRRMTTQLSLHDFPREWYPARVLRLTDRYRDVLIWFTGTVWTDSSARRAASHFQRGEQAWICQRCAGCSLCQTCGTPLAQTPTWDWIADDAGTVTHSPYFTGFGTTVCSQCGTQRRNMK
jgi:hypothetical protein